MNTGVKSVWGKCNDVDVVFARNSQGLWEVAVPAPENLMYVLELWAEDNAGNQGYLATIRVIFSPEDMHMSIEVIEMGSMFSKDDLMQIFGDFYSQPAEDELTLTNINTEFTSDEMKSEIKYIDA